VPSSAAKASLATFSPSFHYSFLKTGSAAFCLLSEHMTVVRQRIDVPVPRKSASSTAHEKGLEKFYSTLYTTFLRHIPYSDPSMRAIVIASPGWIRDSVLDYIFKEATRTGNKALIGARNKFVKVHVTSPHVHSLVEVLKSPEVEICLFIADEQC
jgi:protein pelota